MGFIWTSEDLEDLVLKDLSQSATIPSKWFTDAALLEAEKYHIFAGSWHYVGHESQISNAGDLIADEIIGRPILVVRDQNGCLRCLANVCRHRGGPLVKAHGVSNSRVLRCAYHAWSYNLEGRLIGAPKFEGALNFDKPNCRLPEYRVETYEGLIFVCFAAEPKQSLDSYMHGIKEAISPIDLKTMRFYQRVKYTVRCNWKVYVDNYMEGYHILPVHPSLSKILDIDGYKTTIDQHKVLQFGPLSGDNNPYHTSGAAFYYQLFPNLMLNILPGRLQTNTIIPIDVDHCSIVFDFYYSESDSAMLKIKAKDDLAISELIQQEDIEICEYVQKGLKSGSYNRGRLCPSEELGVWAFQNNLRKAYQLMISDA